MPPPRRESPAQQIDKEWRELAIESLASLTERVHKLELENAILKVKWGFMMGAIGFATSIVTTIVSKWIVK